MTPRSRHRRISLVSACLLGISCRLYTQQPPASATLIFHFERAGLPVPEYTLTVHEDGTGTYTASYTAPAPETNPRYAAAATVASPPQLVTRPITLSHATTARLFDRVRSTSHFQGGCESHQ